MLRLRKVDAHVSGPRSASHHTFLTELQLALATDVEGVPWCTLPKICIRQTQ